MKKTIYFFIYILISVILVGSFFIRNQFPTVSFDELYFYLTNGVTNSDGNVFIDAIKKCLPFFILLMITIYIVFYDISFNRLKINCTIKKKKKKIQVYPFKLIQKHRAIATAVLSLIALIIATNNINCINYIKNSSTNSKFIEINYVNPQEAKISFKEKKNLILIVVESLETSFFTKNQGGYWNYPVTPELYELLTDKDSVVFYNNNYAEEMKMVNGASWTTASVVANTTGLPFKIPVSANDYYSENFMNGAYGLGDILANQGYHNEVISSARTNFGGLGDYFNNHGKFDIIDINSLSKYGLSVSKKDLNEWGFGDRYLFQTAKKRLQKIAKEEQPFNLELISIDTHFTDGFIYNYSFSEYDTQYENVYATTSYLIYDFVSWVKKQDFYEDTTIVILGDHLSMQTNYFKKRGIDDRYVYSCYINPYSKPKNKENRVYTALDTYPSIISAIGGKSSGERLGLGVNLFSSKKTLAERYGFEKMNKEIIKQSDFYNENILGADYKKMIDNKE